MLRCIDGKAGSGMKNRWVFLIIVKSNPEKVLRGLEGFGRLRFPDF
jgi:hypothetical protein